MRYKLIVKSNPSSPAQEEEFNHWYSNVHLGQILELPGFHAAERFIFAETQLKGTPEPSLRYLVIYDIETDDLSASIAAMRERLGTPRLNISDAIDIKSAQMEIYVALAGGPTYAIDKKRP
jgi:hypothetical protein